MATTKTLGKTRSTGRKSTGGKPAPNTVGEAKRPTTHKQAPPALDIEKILTGFKLPGVDVKLIIEGRRADIKAVTLANKLAYDGMKALAKRQAEMLREAIAEWRAAVKDLTAPDRDALTALRTDLAKQAIQKALANVRELAELAAKSQAEAWDPVGKRFRDKLADMKKALRLS